MSKHRKQWWNGAFRPAVVPAPNPILTLRGKVRAELTSGSRRRGAETAA